MAGGAMFADWSQRYDVPWRELEAQGLLPPPNGEIRCASPDRQMEYALADKRRQFRIAA